MGGFSRNARGGKRSFSSSPSSSYPYAYYLTTAIFVIICIAGAWLLGSFSIFPSGATSSGGLSHKSRALSLADSDPPPVMEDTQVELPEETTKDPVEKDTIKGREGEGGESNGEEADPERKKEEVEVEVLRAERQPKELQEEVSSEDREKQNEGETGKFPWNSGFPIKRSHLELYNVLTKAGSKAGYVFIFIFFI